MSLLRLNARKKRAPERRYMTKAEIEAALAVGPQRVTYLPGSAYKRFAQTIYDVATGPLPTITEAQSEYLFKLRHRFRRQIPDSVPFANSTPSENAG